MIPYIYSPIFDAELPPNTATAPTETHPFRVWAWECFANGWVCIAMFMQRADARTFIARETGRVSGLYLQTPAGIEHFSPDRR